MTSSLPPGLDPRDVDRFEAIVHELEARLRSEAPEDRFHMIVPILGPDMEWRRFDISTPEGLRDAALMRLSADKARRADLLAVDRVAPARDDLRSNDVPAARPRPPMYGGKPRGPAGATGLQPSTKGQLDPLLEYGQRLLRARGFTPSPNPYRPKGWRSLLWLGASAKGEAALAVPVRTASLRELERRLGSLADWKLPLPDGSKVHADLVILLLPEDEPVRVAVRHEGIHPRFEVVYCPGVSARNADRAMAPFHHAFHLEVFYEDETPTTR